MEMLEAHEKVWREIQQKQDVETAPQEPKPRPRKPRKMKIAQAPKDELERYAVPAV
jgi:hypothetical protein